MNAPGHPSVLVPLLIAALVAWRLYSRVRRLVGRQRLSKVRPWITICIFPVLTALFVASSIGRPLSLLSLIGGAVVGVALGVYGLRVTRFETAADGLYYTPAAHLGIALSVLVVARIGYRFAQVYYFGPNLGAPTLDGAPPAHPMAYASTPATLLIFGAFAGYYVTYAIGLLRWRRSIPVAASPAPNVDTIG
jgi:hypothetical protein